MATLHKLYTFLLLIFINYFPNSLAKHTDSKEHYLECEISLANHFDKSCRVTTTTCTINLLHGIDNDTRLVFTNAKERNFTDVIFPDSNFPVLGKYIAEQFSQMTNLEISYGKLKRIDDFAFAQARELTHLKLAGNEIQEITYSTFRGADNLKKLDLSMNEIKEIGYEVFERITELEDLDLGWNKLTTLHEKTFSYLRKLKRLVLQENKIKTIHSSIVAENKQLYHLDLSSNPMSDIHLQIANSKFHSIDLNRCPLKQLTIL